MFEDLNVLFQANTAKKLNKYIIAMEITMKITIFVRINKSILCGNNTTKIAY